MGIGNSQLYPNFPDFPCFMFIIEDAISQLPAPAVMSAICWHAFPLRLTHHSGGIHQNKPCDKLLFVTKPYYSSRKTTNTELGNSGRVIIMKNLTMLVFGEMQKILELWNRKAIEFCKQNFMSCSNRILENNNPEGTLKNGDTVQEDPEGSKDNWSNSHSCDVQVQHLSIFCLCSKNLTKAQLKYIDQFHWWRIFQDSISLYPRLGVMSPLYRSSAKTK